MQGAFSAPFVWLPFPGRCPGLVCGCAVGADGRFDESWYGIAGVCIGGLEPRQPWRPVAAGTPSGVSTGKVAAGAFYGRAKRDGVEVPLQGTILSCPPRAAYLRPGLRWMPPLRGALFGRLWFSTGAAYLRPPHYRARSPRLSARSFGDSLCVLRWICSSKALTPRRGLTKSYLGKNDTGEKYLNVIFLR